MLHFDADTGLEFLSLVDQCIRFVIFAQGPALAWMYGDVPGDIGFCVRSLFNASLACVAKGQFLCTV